jgi:hypothetical protein
MSCAKSGLFLIVGCALMCVGIWEAGTASHHNPKYNNYTSDIIEGYVFCVTKCVLNIIGAVACIIYGFLFCFINDEIESKDNNTILQIFSLGVSIWGVVMYFNNYDLGPFQNIIFVETIIFLVELGIFALLLFGVCCFGIYASIISDDDQKNQIPNSKQINIVENSKQINIIADNL